MRLNVRNMQLCENMFGASHLENIRARLTFRNFMAFSLQFFLCFSPFGVIIGMHSQPSK
jgi:hypothetical protein